MQRKTILVGSLYHESNTLSPLITGIDDFKIARGDELYAACGSRSALAGIVDALREYNAYDLVPTIFARAVPNGLVDADLYRQLKAELLAVAAANRDQLDGVVLALHGSMFIDEIGDAEGDLLTDLRTILPYVPVVAALDTHATLTEAMCAGLDAMVAYKEAPHTDTYETGRHAAAIAHDFIAGHTRPTTAAVPVPMIIAGEQSETTTEPMRSLMNRCRELETRPGVLGASFLLGFPWADHPANRVNAVVVTDNDPDLAETLAQELADAFWQHRHDFDFCAVALPPRAAIDAALAATTHPVYLSDSGDNPTAGGTADNVELLAELLTHPGVAALDKPALFGGIYDAHATAACIDHVGDTLTLNLGGHHCPYSPPPLQVEAGILAAARNWGTYASDMVLLGIGNLEVIVTAKHVGFVTPEIFRALGAEPADRKLVVVKLGYLTAPHKEVATHAILALSQGCTHQLLADIPFQNLQRPILPLDADFGLARSD